MTLEIWFEFASPYSYLTVSRAEALLRRAGVAFVWRPFLLGPIFREKGWGTSPFVLDPVKGAYMWRDMERRTVRLGVHFTRPAEFPMNGLNAARVMTAALDQEWCGDLARAISAAQFAEGADISDDEVLAKALSACHVDPSFWLAQARRDDVKAQLRAMTAEAQAKGIFGAPSFVVGEGLFWGDDRLEDAAEWAYANVARRHDLAEEGI